MMFKLTDHKKGILFDLGIIAVIVSAVVLAAYKVNGIYPFGDGSVARGDMVQQTIPAGMYYVWDVLHGQASPFFTWNSGLGINISGASALGALLCPLNLFLYFSPRDYLVYFISFLIILKMICIAYAMYFYLDKYEVKGTVKILGGLLYAFGAATLVHFHIMLVMDAAFFLPLLMIGVDRIFDKKGCKFFIAMLAVSMAVNVYTGGMTVIFLFLYSGSRLFLTKTGWDERRRCAMQLGVSVGVGVLLSAVVVIPALYCISGTSRQAGGDLMQTYMRAVKSSWSEGEWKTVQRMVANTALPFAGILYFMVFGKYKFWESVKKYKNYIVVTALMILSVLVAGTELLWHGGSRAMWPVRFVFIVSFALIDFAVFLIQENREKFEQADCVDLFGIKIKKYWLFGIAAVAAVVAGMLFSSYYEGYCENELYEERQDGFLCMAMEFLFAVIYLVLFRIRKNKGIIIWVLCVELTCMSVMSFATNKDTGATFSAEHVEAANTAAKSLEVSPGEFERFKNTDYVIDQIHYPLVFGAEGISNYWHVIDEALQPAFYALGYTINWTQLIDTGGTIFTDTLFHTKYFLSRDGLSGELYDHCQEIESYDGEEMNLYSNKFELPFAINTNVSELEADGEFFANQNHLFSAVTGSDAQLIEDISDHVTDYQFSVPVGEAKKVMYMYGTNGSDNPVSVTVNGETLMIPCSYSTENIAYPADFAGGMLCLGVFQNENVTLQFGGNAGLHDLHLALLDYDTFVNGVEKVKAENPQIMSLKQKHSGIDIELDNVTKDNILIPVMYDEGWSCRVNGTAAEHINTVDGMLSVPVSKGKCRIELRYTAPGRSAGAVVSSVVLLALAGFVLLDKKKKIGEAKAIRIAEYAACGLFLLLFAAFLVVMFVIPLFHHLFLGETPV